MNLRKRILFVTIPINIIAIISIYIIVKKNAFHTIEKQTAQYTSGLLSSATLSIKNQYASLEYHKDYATNLRKKERQHILSIAKSIINLYHNKYLNGQLTKSEAQKKAIEEISKFRYDNGNGYIWINDTQLPNPVILYHPLYPEFKGKPSNHPIWYTSKDSSNIAGLAVKLCKKNGSGFINYFWKKPSQEDTDHSKLKTSFVELYEPWQWILGTGIYLEDIDKDASIRLEAIKEELTQTLGKMKLGNAGYFFIFNSEKELILHPLLDSSISDSVFNYLMRNAPFDEIMKASLTTNKSYTYKWYNPLDNDRMHDDYSKKVFVEYFEPLDWYICASFYFSELEKPGILLGQKILFISTLFILLSGIAILYLSNTITKPLNHLINYVTQISKNFQDANLDLLPHFKSYEANALGKVMKEMLISLKNQHSSLIEEKNKALESEARIRDNEIKFRALFESSNDSIFLIKENKIISCNHRMYELFKCNDDNIINKSLSELSPEYQLDGQLSTTKTKLILDEALKGIPQFFEWQHQRPNGETFIASVSLNLVELGSERYVQASIHDITERKKQEYELEKYRKNLEKMVDERTEKLNKTNKILSEKNNVIVTQNNELKDTLEKLEIIKNQLQKAEQLYHGIFDYSPLAIFVFNKDGIMTECNDLFLEVNGAPKEKLIGLNMIEKLPDQKMVTEIKRTLKDGHGYFEGFYTSAVSGKSGYFRLLYTALRDENDNISGGIGMLEDITVRYTVEQEKEEALQKWVAVNEELKNTNIELSSTIKDLKEAQSQLIQSEKMASLGILTAGVAHEINNPLNFVKNGALALKATLESEISIKKDEYLPFFDAILNGTDRITAIVKSLSRYSRTQKTNASLCNVNEILDNCLTMLHNQYKNKIQINKNYSKNLPLISTNEGELHQVFLNIIANAIQAIPDKGIIDIDTILTKGYIQIKISDSGTGIEKENLMKIFDPFYTTKAPGKGTGLGLSITKKLIEELGGNIECISKIKKGSSFIINIPIKQN